MKQDFRVMSSLKPVVITAFLMLFTVLAMISVKPAYAHAKLIKSDPPRRAVLSNSPEKIQLWFNEEIEGSFASISVFDANKKLITEAKPELVEDDLKSLVLALPEMPGGRYTVEFRIMSVDGHVAESDFNFTVKHTEPKE